MVQKFIVLSTGGGIVLSDKNESFYHQEEQYFSINSIYIQVERTSKDKDRLLKNDPTKILTELHKEREALYQNVADFVVDTENKSSQEVASEIVNLIKA